MGILFGVVGFVAGMVFGGVEELTAGGFIIGLVVGMIKVGIEKDE